MKRMKRGQDPFLDRLLAASRSSFEKRVLTPFLKARR
jgi:hypothetical protein